MTNYQKTKERLKLMRDLCKLDIRQRTAGTAFGTIWIYLSSAISITIIWFVFHFGLRSSVGAQALYSLLVGLMAWQLILDSVLSGAAAYTEKPYLVKKIKFPLLYLPVIKVINSFWFHFPFVILILLISIFSGQFSLSGFVIYALFMPFVFVFITTLVFLLSTIAVFYRDLQSLLGVMTQLFFWFTPIIWTIPKEPEFMRWIQIGNPFYTIIAVYRFSFLGESFPALEACAAFFGILVVLMFVTRKVYRKLKDQFADVL